MILQNHKHFQCQNIRCRVFQAGYWHDFQNLLVISREQAKTWSLIFSSTKKCKNVKIIRTGTESTYLLVQASKKISL
jgi:hypothetical protein